MENFREQKSRHRIGPRGKLGRFKSTTEKFLVYIALVSLVSGQIQSLTPWYAAVLHE
jgi:hypothetical protein